MPLAELSQHLNHLKSWKAFLTRQSQRSQWVFFSRRTLYPNTRTLKVGPPLLQTDLDIFGSQSVFSLIDECHTEGGKEVLSSWLINPELDETVLNRRKKFIEALTQAQWKVCKYFVKFCEKIALKNNEITLKNLSQPLWNASDRTKSKILLATYAATYMVAWLAFQGYFFLSIPCSPLEFTF